MAITTQALAGTHRHSNHRWGMILKLYEVAGADVEFRPSPYCWRTRLALVHKGLAFEPIPWRAVEKQRIARSGGGTVPVLVDGERWIRESWDIALYLEATYPDRPPLFSGAGDQAKAYFLDTWTTEVVHPLLARALLLDQFELLAPEDKTYYRERTRRKFGETLEDLCQDPDDSIVQLNKILSPLQQVLKRHDFLGGAAPGYGDYIVFGAFQWARVASKRQVIEHNCPVAHWFSRLLNAFNGFAASQPDRSYWD